MGLERLTELKFRLPGGNRVAIDSRTETFVALKLYINNLRWSGVPFYIKTGKRLTQKSTEIIVEFKGGAHPVYLSENKNIMPNLLVIRIQPLEGIFLQFNAKRPGTDNIILPVQMDYCQNCQWVKIHRRPMSV